MQDGSTLSAGRWDTQKSPGGVQNQIEIPPSVTPQSDSTSTSGRYRHPEKESKGLGWGQEFGFGLEGEGALKTRNLEGMPMGTGMWAGGGEPGGRGPQRHR